MVRRSTRNQGKGNLKDDDSPQYADATEMKVDDAVDEEEEMLDDDNDDNDNKSDDEGAAIIENRGNFVSVSVGIPKRVDRTALPRLPAGMKWKCVPMFPYVWMTIWSV